MEGFAEATIPERQFENIHIRYNFVNLTEKERAIEQLIQDCIDLHQKVSRIAVTKNTTEEQKEADYFLSEQKELEKMEGILPDSKFGVTEHKTIDSISFRKRKGVWEYFEMAINPRRWVSVKPEDLKRLGLE